MTDEEVIHAYYDHFNGRRLTDVAALLADDAHIDHASLFVADGKATYLAFADRWLTAFPDLHLTIEKIDHIREEWHEVYLLGEGTHQGEFDMGPLGVAKPTHRRGRLRLRHLLQIRDGRILSSTLSFDTNGLIRNLTR